MDRTRIKHHSRVVGADGIEIGVVDGVEGDHIKLTRSGDPAGHHRFVPLSLVTDVDEETVRLSADAEVALDFSEEEADEPGTGQPGPAAA